MVSRRPVHIARGVVIEPSEADSNVDCRLFFMGDRYRQLVRAYAEAVFRLSRERLLPEREAYLRRSAEVAEFYHVEAGNGKLSLRMRDSVFSEQAPLDELDIALQASDGVVTHRLSLPLARLRAVGALLPLLNGEYGEAEVLAGLEASLPPEDAEWARELLRNWTRRHFVKTGPSRPNPLLASKAHPRVTFMGHSSILFQSRASSVLTDPLFRVSLGCPPIAFEASRLRLGAICCSHSHWDHCDVATLLRFDKSTPIVVPRVRKPTAFNPPIVPVLRLLGFTQIHEIDVWEARKIDDIEVVAVPFHGEQDEPGAEIDHYTYLLRTDGLTVYGGVDAYRDTFGEMLPALERVRREWPPDVAFLPVSRMTYAWRHGGVNGFCRYLDTELLDQVFQYTAGADQAVEWARTLSARWVVPYAMFNFSPFDVPNQSREFDQALRKAGMSDRFLPLRPFDYIDAPDLNGGIRSRAWRQYLIAVVRASAAARRLDRRLGGNLGYRLVKRLLRRDSGRTTQHHH